MIPKATRYFSHSISIWRINYRTNDSSHNFLKTIECVLSAPSTNITQMELALSDKCQMYPQYEVLEKYIKYVFICKILGFHGGDYEECRLLGCGAV
jgi:hypothetical protein